MVKVRCSCGRKTGESVCGRSTDGVVSGQEAKPIPCDEQCELEERNRKLAEAFGISPSANSNSNVAQFSDLVVNLVRMSPQFVKKLEVVFDEFMKSNPSVTKLHLPPMDRVKRQLVHEMAKYYRFETQSLDKEPIRSVVITRTRDSRIPPVLFSESSLLRPHHQDPSRPNSTLCALHIYNLQSYVKTQHLISFLTPFAGHYKLQWVDDTNCLAIFPNEITMRTALSELSGGMFAVKVYKDQFETTPTDFHMTPLAPKEKRSTAPKMVVLKEAWHEDQNSFKLLSEDNHHEKVKNKSTNRTTATTTTSGDAWDDGVDDNKPEPEVILEHVPAKTENMEEGFSVIHANEELVDDWTLLDDILPALNQNKKPQEDQQIKEEKE